MKIQLDSDVLISVMRQKLSLSNSDEYYINPIVYGEVAFGFEDRGLDLSDFDKYLDSYHIFPINMSFSTGKIYAQLKVKLKHNPIADNDLLVACSAIDYNMKLWTLNKKHFTRIPNLELFNNS